MYEKLYKRLGARYPYLLLGCAAASIPVLTVPVVAQLLLFDLGERGDYAEILMIAVPWMGVVGVVAEVAVARTIDAPLLSWIKSRDPACAQAAWHAAVADLTRAVVLGGSIAMLGSLPLTIYVAQRLDVGGPLLTFGTVVTVDVCIFLGAVIHYFLWERALRPVVADLAEQLPVDFEPKARSVSVSGRLLLLIPAMNMVTGFVVAGAAGGIDSLGPGGRFVVGAAVASVVSATAALTLTLMLRRSLTRPIGELLRAMTRVRQGNLDAHVPVMSGDEIGVVTSHFNIMLEGLKERARLAGENEELHEQIRAQLEEVQASRARIIAASDAERRRVERNLHDGAQQHLVGLALQLRLLEETTDDDALRASLGQAGAQLSEALSELRELARGLHPQVLSVGGLGAALPQLADRVPVPVEVCATSDRFPEAVESTAYFVVSEALANVAKYAKASSAEVRAERQNGSLVVSVADDGVGGADPSAGSGLAGLVDRVAALQGRLAIESAPGAGTRVTVELPVS